MILSLFSSEIRLAGSKKDEILVNCPFCINKGKTEDITGHLYINIRSNRFICHRCGTHGLNIYSVLPELKYNEDFTRSDLLEYFTREKKVYYNLEKISIPIKQGGVVFNYLRSRKVFLGDIENYNLREGIDDYKGRVVIPNFELGTGKCDYFISRSVMKNSYLRYKNPTSKKTDILMNFYNSFSDPITFVTEGWFTGYSFGDNFVSYLGSFISKIQSMKISELKEVFYCPDGDVSAELIIKNLSMMLRFRSRVFLVAVPRIKKFDAENLSSRFRKEAFNKAKEFRNKDLTITEKELETWYDSIFPLNLNTN